jgi:hypothetical protein
MPLEVDSGEGGSELPTAVEEIVALVGLTSVREVE